MSGTDSEKREIVNTKRKSTAGESEWQRFCIEFAPRLGTVLLVF